MTKAIPFILVLVFLAAGCASMDDMSSDGKMMKDSTMQNDTMMDGMKEDKKM